MRCWDLSHNKKIIFHLPTDPQGPGASLSDFISFMQLYKTDISKVGLNLNINNFSDKFLCIVSHYLTCKASTQENVLFY